MYQFIGHTHS